MNNIDIIEIVQKRIQIGKELSEREIRTDEECEILLSEKGKWDRFNKELLKKYLGESRRTDYKNSIRQVVFPMGISIQRDAEKKKTFIKRGMDYLESIIEMIQCGLISGNITVDVEPSVNKSKKTIKGQRNIVAEGCDVDIDGDDNVVLPAGNYGPMIAGTRAEGPPGSTVMGTDAKVFSPPPKSSQIIESAGKAIKDIGTGVKNATPSLKNLLVGDENSGDEENENG